MYDDFLVVRKYGKLSAKFLSGTSTVIEKVELLSHFLCLARTTIRILLSFIIYLEHACLIDCQSQLFMDLKSNRLSLWRHMQDYVANIQTMSHDMIKLKLSQHFCRVAW